MKKKIKLKPAQKIAIRREHITNLLAAGITFDKEKDIQDVAEKFGCTKETIKKDIVLQRAEFDVTALEKIVKLKWNGCRKRSEQYGVLNDLEYNELLNLYLESSGDCHYCNKKLKNKAHLVIDHVIPISKGGGNTLNNIVLSCWLCNLRKGDSLINESRLANQWICGQ